MNITCALSSGQIKGLFQYVYKTMAESLAENKIFNADEVMKNLFNKIEKTKDADIAAKFLQIVPQMIGTASYQTSLINLEFDPKSDPRKLAQKFMNSETGLLDVLQYFRPKDIIKEIQNDVNIKNNSINSPKFTEDTDVPVSPRYKASSAFTTTMQQFITRDPNNNLTIEEIDPNKVRIYNTLEKLKKAFNSKDNSVLNPTYQGRLLKLKGVRLDSVAASLDKTTAALLAKANSIEFNKTGKNFLKDAIILMVTDEFGTPINFSEEGDIDSNGKPVYQFLRNVTVDEETGDYTIKDIYGKEERIQSVEDQITNYGSSIYGTKSLNEFKQVLEAEGESYDDLYNDLKQQQQADFKALLDVHKEILKEKEKLFDIMDVSAGIPLDFTGGNMPLNDFLKLSDNLNTNYKFTTLRTERDDIKAGNTVISINGYEIPVDRKNMSADLINKIAAALVSSKMDGMEKYAFYDQFSHNNINFKDKKLFVVYKPESGLEVSYKEDAKNPKREIVDLTNKEIAKAIIIKALGTERGTASKPYSANMKINADLLETPTQFFDYDLNDDAPVPANYRDFLSKVNPTVKFKNNEPGVYNSYFAFRVNDNLSKELKKAKEKVQEKTYTNTDSNIRKAKDALLLKLTENEKISGTVTGSVTKTTFIIQVDGKSVQGRFEEGLSITSVPTNKIVRFSVGEAIEDGKRITDVISIYAGDKKIGQVSETDYKAGEKPRTYEDAKIADEKVINPAGVPQPSDKKGKRSGISKLWDRSSKLPNDVTQEEVDAAQEWWENSPLSKFIELEHMANIVNSDVYARFIIAGKRLEDTKIQLDTATGGSAVDLYHEAWHAFSQLYLTKRQKTKLYAETRKRLNNNNLTTLEVEEIIAEDFRTYAKDPKPTGDAPVRNTIFRQIWNFIKKLFGQRTTKDELFEKLFFASKNPKLLNKYAPLVDNAMFDILNRDRGILNVETKELELSFQDSMTVSSQIDSALSELIDEIYTDRVEREKEGEVGKNNVPIKATRNGTISLLTNDKDKAIAYQAIYERFEDNLAYFQDQLDTVDEDDYNKVTLLTDKVRILKAALENWGDSNSGVVKFHIDNSTFDLIKQKYIEIEAEDELSEDDDNSAPETAEESEKFADKKVGDKSLLQLAEKETLYIIKSLFKIADGKQVMGKLGFPELADFSRTWNIVTKVIGGEKDPVKMYEKLIAGTKSFPELKQLIENKIPDPREIHNIEEFNIKAAFWQDFKKTKLKYLQLTVDNPDGTEYKSEVTEASIEFTNVINKFKSEFKASPKSTYINKGDDNKSILNLDKVIADFDDKSFDSRKSIQFARAIGINLQDLSALKTELDNNKDDYGIQYLFNVTKAIHKISKDPNASTIHKNFIKKFLSDPIGALYGEIPKGIYKDVTSEKNIIQKLAKLQSAFGTNYSSFSVLNPEKNLVNEFIEDNTVSMIVDAINNVSTGNALWTSDEYQYMSYLNPEINGFTLQSQILKSIFEYSNNTLNERKGDAKIELAMVAGSQIVDEKGANTTSLDVQSKYIQELNMMLKGGIVEFMRHASKSSSFGMRLANSVSGGLGKADTNSRLYVDIDMFGPNGNADQYAVNNIFIGYIQAELTRIQKFKGNKELFKQYNGYNRNVGTKENPIYAGEQFTAFDNVLKDFTTTINGEEKTIDLKQYLIDNVKDGDLKNYLKSNPEIKKAITEQVTKYFNGQTDKNYKQFSESPFYDPALMNKLNVFTTLEEEDKHKLLVKAYTMNAWIHNFETASLVYGDIVQYNHAKQELHKRNTGSTSGGRGFMDDIYTQQFLNSDLIKKSSYAFKLANKAGYGADYNTFNYSNKYNTAIMQDVSRDSVYVRHIEKALRDDYTKRGVSKAEIEKRIAKEIDKYKEMEEGDGQGFIAIDAYRNLRLAEKSWSADQEKLFQDIINEKEIKAEDVVRFFPVYKLQHFGHLANTMLPVNAMHKFALMPLIPSMIKGSDLESLHHQMMKGNIQYATFQTGSKTGGVTSQLDKDGKAVADQIYDDKGVEKTLKSDIKFTPNTIYLSNLKNVTAVPTKYKGKTVFSTQLRKLILEGLYQDGEIVNKDYAPYVKAYETAINDYTDLLKTELLEEIGYEKVNGKYVSGDISKFMDVVQRELERKDLPEHLIKYIQVGKDNKITKDLSLHLLADDIEKILVSLVEKRIVKQKVKGEALVQVASSMSNGLWDSGFKFDKANTKDIEKYLGSNNLPFYYPGADGKTTAMKVAIALQGDFKNLLKLNHIDKKPIGTRERLNEMIKNDEWLNKGNNRKAITMTAVRIPVQGLNSMEFMEVYEFLDPSAGNIIIPPSEIVAKSGADFDVDKLTTFMPNIDAEGHYIETSMDAKKFETQINAAKKSGDKGEMKRLIKMQKAALENRLIDSIRGILELPDNYATLVRPNDTYLLKDIADELVNSSPEYKEFKTISPTNVLEVGYNLHKHEANMIGKDVLGIIALENALHPLLTSLGAALPKTYKHQTWDNENKRYVEVPEIDYEMRLLLNHNKTNDGRISLSKINSSDNQDKIADLISHLMNGSVDVEKDAWIFFIQANKEIVPVLLSLLKAGVPKREAIYFVSQPLVKEYARQQRLIGSAFANVTDNGVSANENEKYIALQNTLAVSGISFRYPYLSRDASNLKMFDALKATKDKVKVKFKDGTFKVFAPKELLKAIANNTIKKDNISDIFNAVVKYKLDEEGNPELDDYGQKVQIPLYKKVTTSHLLSNDNWYYVTQVLTKDVNKFSEAELKTNIDNNDFTSDSAIKAFLHFIEFEKEIKGLSNLKRQANPDTKTSKTIQEVTQKSLSLEEAADSSKIEPELARKLQEESILGTFFDKMIITDIVSPLFNVTNNKNVSDHMVKTITRKGGQITKKFGEGKDGVEAYITAYKNAIVNYIYQNKLNNIITTEESFPGIPESFTDIDSKEYIDNFMIMLSEHSHLKELYPILEQITDIPVRSKKGAEVTYTTTLTLNNKSAVKGALAEAYHQNLVDLADDNIIKVNDPEQNKEISDMFKMLPLMSILQNGVGSTKYGLSYVLPDTTFFEIIEPASREFLALDSESKDKTLDIIDNLLFENGVGQNNYILSRASRKASNIKDTDVDIEVENEKYVPKGVVSAGGQGMTFGAQPSTSVNSNDIYSQLENKNVVISNIKTKDGKYDRDANIKEAKANNRVYTMEMVSDINSFSNPWAHFIRTGTIKTNTTKEAVINYIDWLTTDKFKDVKPKRKAFILDVLKSGKLKGRQLQYYAELGEPSHATALDYLINKYDWNTQPSTSVEIDFQEEPTTGYKNRTVKNASADATIALAYDFNSAGERLTKSSVLGQNKKYIPLNIPKKTETSDISKANIRTQIKIVVDQLNSVNATTLNIAGNGIYTMKDAGWSQEEVDLMTYRILQGVLESPDLKNKIVSIRTGGQTGFDEAGAKAGIKLGIPTTILAPKGWTFRNIEGKDISNEQQFKARFSTTQQQAPVTEVKEGVEDLFKDRPELSDIGTPEQYSAYLDTIFPNSIVKDIVYHGTPYLFDKFDSTLRGVNTGKSTTNEKFDSELATFFTDSEYTAHSYSLIGTQEKRLKIAKGLFKLSMSNNLQEDYNLLKKQFPEIVPQLKGLREKGLNTIDSINYLKEEYSKMMYTDIINMTDYLKRKKNVSIEDKQRIQKEIDELIKKGGFINNTKKVVLNIKNPIIKDFNGQPFVDQPDGTLGAKTELTRLINTAAKNSNDAVIAKNIKDPGKSTNYAILSTDNAHILGNKQDIEGFKNFVNGNIQRQTEDETTDENVQSDNTVTYKPTGQKTQTYTVEGASIFNKNGVEVFKEASSDRNKIFANLAVKQGRAVIVERRTYIDKEGIAVTAKYVVNNKDVIISVRTGDIMKWPENNGDRKAVIALAKAAFAEAASEKAEINQDMEAFNAEVTKQGKLPKEFIVDQRKWVLNNMKLYDLVDEASGTMFLKNINMFTGAQVEEIPSNKPVNRKQLINFTKQLSSGITSYKLDQILAEKGIDINDVYGAIEKVETQAQLNNLINKILKAIC